MKKTFGKRFFLTAGLVTTMLTPLSLAAACGSETVDLVQSKTISSINAFTVLPSSLHDFLEGSSVAANPEIASYLFYDGTDLTKEQLEVMPNAKGSTSKPRTTAYDESKRVLGLKIIPSVGNDFAEKVFNITESSGIDKVRSHIDAHPQYKLIDPSGVSVALDANNKFTINEFPNMPLGAIMKYDFLDHTNLSAKELKLYLDAVQPTKSILRANLKAYIASEDEGRYVVSVDKKATPTII